MSNIALSFTMRPCQYDANQEWANESHLGIIECILLITETDWPVTKHAFKIDKLTIKSATSECF